MTTLLHPTAEKTETEVQKTQKAKQTSQKYKIRHNTLK